MTNKMILAKFKLHRPLRGEGLAGGEGEAESSNTRLARDIRTLNFDGQTIQIDKATPMHACQGMCVRIA